LQQQPVQDTGYVYSSSFEEYKLRHGFGPDAQKGRRTRTQAFDTLAFLEAVPPAAMEQPSIAKFVNSKLMADTATLLSGPRLGGWVRDSLLSQELGIPAQNSLNISHKTMKILSVRANAEVSMCSRGRGGSSK